MTSYADDFTLLSSAPSIVEAEARANQLCAILVRWADGKQLAITPQKSSVTLFTSDTHQSRLHPQVRIGDAVAPLNRTPKILGINLDTHFTFSPHARDCFKRTSRALNVMKALAGASRPKPWWPRIRPSCEPSWTMLPPSGSSKYRPPIWTNLRWSRTKPWGSRPDAIKMPRRPTSGRRLGSSSWGRT